MVQLRTFGRLELKGHDGRELLAILAQPKRTAVLAYLAATTPRGFHRRDALLALFWPDHDQAHARAALRKAIYAIRQSIGDDILAGRGEEEIGLAFDQFRCDAAEFTDAIERGDDQRALELYSGDFLPGFFLSDEREFERWLDRTRDDFRRQAFNAAWRLAERDERAGDGFGAAKWARHAASLAIDDEAAVCRLIGLLDRIGDRAGALATYDDFAQRLAQDYEVEPAGETQSLIQAIRNRLPILLPRTEPTQSVTVEQHAPDPRSIAVLPFVNLSGDSDNEYFSDGITEELIHRISIVDGLRVAARTSSFLFKGKSAETGEIARRLNVAHVLEGSVRKAGNRLRITAQLIDLDDGYHAWSEIYDRQLDDVFALQTEIAQAIAIAMKVQLSDRERGQVTRVGTHDPQAYQFYLKGRYFWNQRTEPALHRAIACFQDAIARDPAYARAHTGVADSYNQLAVYGFLPGTQAYAQAKQSAQIALSLDPNLAEAHASYGFTLGQHDYDWAGAEAAMRRAIALDPRYATAHQWYNLVLMTLGRVHEGTLELDRARALEPLSLGILTDICRDCYLAREYDCAARHLRIALEIDPSFARAHGALALALLELNEVDEAVREFGTAIELAGGWYPTRWGQAGLARAFAISGKTAEARGILDQLEHPGDRYVSPEVIAIVHAALGDIPRALAELQRAVRERSINLVFALRDPAFDPLRNEPAFDRLLEETQLRPRAVSD
jgi:TolB-like protein/tetratricopeptide (TPR) repeat protein